MSPDSVRWDRLKPAVSGLRTFMKGVWSFLNSKFGLWLLSAIVLNHAQQAYSEREAARKEQTLKNERVQSLKWEAYYRLRQFQAALLLREDGPACDDLSVVLNSPESGIRSEEAPDRLLRDIVFADSLRDRSLRSLLWDLQLVRYGNVEARPKRFEPLETKSVPKWLSSPNDSFTVNECSGDRPEALVFCELDRLETLCHLMQDDGNFVGAEKGPVSQTKVLERLEVIFDQLERIPNRWK